MTHCWTKRAKCTQTGVALVELTIVVAVLISISTFFWNLWSTQELKLSMVAAATAVLNDPKVSRVPVYSTDISGRIVPYPNGSAQLTAGLTRLAELIVQDIKNASPISASASGLVCAVELSYLTLVNPVSPTTQPGRVKAIAPITPVASKSAGGTPSAQLLNLMSQARSRYYNRSIGLKLLGPAIQTQLQPNQTTPDDIYFKWHAYYVWGCEGQSIFMGFSPIDSKLVETVVPER